MNGTGNSHQLCLRDGFPMVVIEGAPTCTVEHADAAVGGQRVEDVRLLDGYVWLTFQYGNRLPLTCPCCGGSLHLHSMGIGELRRLLANRTVEGFRHGEWVTNGKPPRRHPVFALQFSGVEDLSARTIQVHLASVREIRRPTASPDIASPLL